MKTIKLCLIGLAVLALGFTVGCGETTDSPGTGGDGDADGDGDVDGGDTDSMAEWDLSECDTSLLCSTLADPSDCVADFGLGTNQAGFPPDGYADYVGFYAYNDHTSDSMVPKPNPDMSEPAEKTTTCDTLSPNYANDFALHMTATEYVLWGAGVGMDWGGPSNPNCDEAQVPGALDCLQIGIDDDKFKVVDAEADPRCQNADGTVSEEKMDCLKRGKVIKQPRDLSAYVGIGFWILTTEENEATTVKVSFPIPDTARFYGECTDDDDVSSNDCFNDYYTTVNLSKANAGKWVYKTVMFEDISWNIYWGLQLDTLGYGAFPADLSMGVKFQVDTIAASGTFPKTDFYLDDITLIK